MTTFPLSCTAMQRRSSEAALAFSILLFVTLFLITVPETTQDTPGYARQTVTYMQGGEPTLLWEFGHLLWRPLGLALWRAVHPLMASWSGGSTTVEIIALLCAVNAIAGLTLTVLMFAICRRLGLREWSAFSITGGVLLCSPVLNYVHSGMSYIPGLTLHFAGLWLILKSVQTARRATLYAILAGIALALAFCLWFPYILSVPAALLAGWLTTSNHNSAPPLLPREQRRRLLAITAVSLTATGAALLLGGAVAGKVSSLPVFMQWIISSGHGYQPGRRLLRFPAGLTRSFIYIGDDGLMLKRFMFGDPYAPVHKADLLFTGAWKVPLVVAAFACLLAGLARRREGWSALAVAVCGILPTFLFAVLVYDPSPSERYLAAYPALIFAVCALLRQSAGFRVTRFGLVVFTFALAAVNLKAYGWDFRTTSALASARVRLIREYADKPGDITLLLDQDPLEQHFWRFPLARENRQGTLPTYVAIVPGNKSVVTWRRDSACRILQAWEDRGNAWLSTRLLAPRPQPGWRWAEYGDRHVKWADLPEFFSLFGTDAQVGNEDGFRRVARTEENRLLLQSYCNAPPPKLEVTCTSDEGDPVALVSRPRRHASYLGTDYN